MIEAIVLACQITISQCTVITAERHEIVSVPKASCTIAAMQWAASNKFLRTGEALKVLCRENEWS